MITKTIAALGFVGAAALLGTSAASAQGFYIGVPGFGVGVGEPYYGYDGYYGGPYAYDYGRWHHGYYGHHWHHWR